MIKRKKTHYMHPEKHYVKNSTIETPMWLSEYIYEIFKKSNLSSWMKHNESVVYDIGCGRGNLSYYFQDDYKCIGIDNRKVRYLPRSGNTGFIQKDFLKMEKEEFSVHKNDLIVCNPPFNDEKKTYGNKLLPELFLRKIFEIWGEKAYVILFSPMGLRLNQKKKSPRWQWLRDIKAEIKSIISLPVDSFEGVLFHSEILFFNVPSTKAHYWLPKK